MIERLILALLLLIIGGTAVVVLRRVHLARLNRVGSGAAVGQPTLLYFRSDHCAACPAQSHYLAQLRQAWPGEVAVRKIDADLETETAVQYGVFTLPTTILMDKTGTVREINYGLTVTQKLVQQLQALA